MSNASAAPRAAAAIDNGLEAAPTLDSLPPEVLGVAFGFLQPLDMMPLPECSRQWRDTDFDNVYWKPVFLQDFSRPTREVEETLDGDSDESHETSSTESSSSGSDSDESDSDASSSEGSDSDESEDSSADASSASDSETWQDEYRAHFLELQYQVREALGRLRRVQDLLFRPIFETSIRYIQDIGQNHVSALGVQTNSSALPRPTCWPRRQKQYVRTHFLRELLNWDTSNEDELSIPLLFVDVLKRRSGNHYEKLLLETLEETIRAKFRQAKEKRERKARWAKAVAAQKVRPEDDVEFVMSLASCSRSNAVEALRAYDGDIVNAIMELTM